MAKEWKLKDDNYISTKSISHNREKLSEVLDGKTEWLNLNPEVRYCKKNGVVFLSCASFGTKTLVANQYTVIGTLPQSYKPSVDVSISSDVLGATVGSTAVVGANGQISIYVQSNQSYWRACGSYPI